VTVFETFTAQLDLLLIGPTTRDTKTLESSSC